MPASTLAPPDPDGGTPGIGPNSHFYTVNYEECQRVKDDPGWTYEGTAFHAFYTQGGSCRSGTVPVYRAYNNRYLQNASNHRYATDRSVLEAMQPQGWQIEGVVFCVPLN